ncbi:MAG: hypothetical protein ACHQF4_09685 [Sphingobacteriales bacterium]
MKQPIELRKFRDFGQIINDSFTFLKENIKGLLVAILVICGFFMVLGTISSVFTIMNKSYAGDFSSDDYQLHSRAVTYLVSLMIYLFVLMLSHLCIFLVTYCYISVYIQKNNTPPVLAEVWGYFRYYFWRVLGGGILIFILSCIGYLLCFIPGIYLMPIFSLIIPIIVIENASVRYSFNKSFRIIKNNWWTVFGVLFIMWIVVVVASLFVNIAIRFIETGSRIFTLKSFTLPVIIIFSALKHLLMVIYVLPAIAVSLCYFSLSEEKDGTGLLERIQKLGTTPNDDLILPTEEY